ncbi:uncharacterized protein DDB_G0286299-like [Venturia canescens]|uniref:uncharacterized protein DDB_G0286299-like n=1 Tax=Venturia canescens TaxID=32260 RepID=UPI001C9C42A3|nr:uncharacterized protein DDB_G0286299-like [Venturia canescens]
MRKTTKRGEEAAVENSDVSPPKKIKLREKKVTLPVVAPNRLPRAAKNRAAAQTYDVENDVEAAKKTRGRAKQPLRRSKSTDNIASMVSGNMKKTKSKSAEHLDQEEDGPPSKKARNPPAKTAKKTVAKKAGNEAKAKPVKKAVEEAAMEDLEEESEEEQRPLIAKKAYSRVPKKAVLVETKEEKPKKRAPVKEPAAAAKTTRGRTKPLPSEEVEEDLEVEEPKEEAKTVKGRKGKANGKKAAAALVEEENKKVAELSEKDVENEAEEVTENMEKAAKPKKAVKKTAAALKKSRANKKTVAAAESDEKDVASDEEVPVEASTVEQEEAKPTKGGKKGKAPAAKKGGKKAQLPPKVLEDKEKDSNVMILGDDQEAVDVPEEPQAEPKENAKSLENEESHSENEVEAGDDNHDSR